MTTPEKFTWCDNSNRKPGGGEGERELSSYRALSALHVRTRGTDCPAAEVREELVWTAWESWSSSWAQPWVSGMEADVTMAGDSRWQRRVSWNDVTNLVGAVVTLTAALNGEVAILRRLVMSVEEVTVNVTNQLVGLRPADLQQMAWDWDTQREDGQPDISSKWETGATWHKH